MLDLYKECAINKVLIISLILFFSGCAAQGKSNNAIFTEASQDLVSNLKPGETGINFRAAEIPSHGMLADSLIISMEGGANASSLKEELIAAKKNGDAGFLILGGNNSLDNAVISGALKNQDLSGLKIYFAGNSDQESQIQKIIEESKADFHFISR